MPSHFIKQTKNRFHPINLKFLLSSLPLSSPAFIAAMGKAGGGRNEIDTRFLKCFAVINLQFPLDSTLKHIYGSILKGHLLTFPQNVQAIADFVVTMTIEMFKIVTVELPPTPSKFHYIFNLKDLSRTYSGVLLTHHTNFKDPRQLVSSSKRKLNEFIYSLQIAGTCLAQ